MVYKSATTLNPATQPGSETSRILHDCRTLYLKQLGQLLQESGPVSAQAVRTFLRTVGDYFDEAASSRHRSGFADARGLTASRISLVGENDLEQEIRLGKFTSDLTALIGGELWHVHLRFITLLERPDLGMADNPVGPKGIALGLAKFCAELGEGHDATLERIDRLEGYFAQHLGVLYHSLNGLLDENKVATAQPTLITSPDVAPPSSRVERSNRPSPAALLQSQLLGPGGGQMANGAAAALFSQATLEKLLARLDELDKAPAQQVKSTSPPTATDRSLETLIPGLFANNEPQPAKPVALDISQLGIPDGAPEAASIDALAQIFEAVFASPSLPDPIKTALGSLQIPMLKAAMLDPGFFTQQDHPARLLFDSMANAAQGLANDVSSQHPLCAGMQAIASRVRNDFVRDRQVFEHALTDLEALVADRNHAAARAAEAYLPLLYQADRRKQAEQRCAKIIEAYLAPGAPADIADFLQQQWQKVLVVSWLEGGEQSPGWQENTEVMGDLLWSIQPKVELDDRNRLTKMLPAMLQRLSAGMARIELPEEQQTAILDLCFSLQTAAMRRSPTPPPANSQKAAPPAADAKPRQSELSNGPLRLKIIDRSSHNAPLRYPMLRPGTWITFPLDEKSPLCGRLCQISPESGMLLLANPDWEFAVAIHPDLLNSQLKAGTARQHTGESLFDSAAEQALHRRTTG